METPKTLQQAIVHFSNPENCNAFMIAMRWADGQVRCPVCDSEKVTYLAKQNRYSSLHAQALYSQGVRAGYIRLLVSPLARFIKFYILRLGFLDGGPGFAHVAIGCFAAFAKYAKLIELSANGQSQHKP